MGARVVATPMPLCAEAELRSLPGFRVKCAPTTEGFVAVVPVSGERLLVAVGSTAEGSAADGRRAPDDAARAEMDVVLRDQALLEGYDVTGLLNRTNAELSRRRAGRVDALAVVSHADVGVPGWVSGAGNPAPLIVTRDHLSAPAGEGAALAEGWVVVLGSESPEGGPFAGLLSPDDVRQGIAMLEGPESPVIRVDRTMLAVALTDPR
jgi:hypothetical protein